MNKVVIYARVSSKEQEEGFSIPAQLDLLRAYADNNNMTVVKEYVDVETAKEAGRTKFGEMSDFLKGQAKADNTEGCQTILVEKTDRLYRNPRDWIDLEDMKVNIHFVKENVIITPDSHSSEKFMHGIKVLMAKNYIDNLGEEASKGMARKAKEGLWPSVAPLGYLNVEIEGKRTINRDPDRYKLIRRMFELYATGNYSMKDLVQPLFDEGLRSRKGKKVNKSTIEVLLKNPLFYGVVEWKGERFDGAHEPIINKSLFDQVKTMIGERRQKPQGKHKYDWAFRGLVRCGHCGCSLVPEIKKKIYTYYRCTGYKGKCPEKYLREEDLDRMFGEVIKAVNIDEEVADWIVAALKSSHADERKYHSETIDRLRKQYDRLQNRVDTAYEDKLDNVITATEFERKCVGWRAEQVEVKKSLEEQEKANVAYIESGVRIIELSKNALDLYNSRPMLEKRKVLEILLSNCSYKDGQLHPEYRKPFDLIAKTNAEYKRKEADFGEEIDLSLFWLPGLDSNQRRGG
jgi:site-specific DNA recombinase